MSINKDKTKKIRLFIGSYLDFIPIETTLAEKLREHFFCPIKFVEPDKIHLTWKFIGDIEPEKVDDIISILDDISSKADNVTIHFDKFEIWHKRNIPSLLVLTGKDANGDAEKLHQTLDKKLARLKIPRENRILNPHITVARYKLKQKPVEKLVLPEWLSFDETCIEFTKLCLIKSTFVQHGNVYTPLKSFDLQSG